MKVYRVGGSVRDELLGRPIVDRDYVVVGATPQEMLAQGFRPVGREFPVFLHPVTHEEYALARTERKRGRGHRGFSFHASPDVTLEQDLGRRDLTINAMARDADGTLIDPYGGAADLDRRTLRHVGPAFIEDPLRVLRVARFAARFDFGVAPETEALLRAIVASGELATLTRERVWQELATALMEAHPSRFFMLLHRCGALTQLMPEVDGGLVVQASDDAVSGAGPETRLLRALDLAAAAGDELAVRYAVLAGDLDAQAAEVRGRQDPARNLRLATALSERVRAPTACRSLAILTARHRHQADRAAELGAAALLDLLLAVDALRRPARLEQLLRTCTALWGASGRSDLPYAPAVELPAALAAVRQVNAAGLARRSRTRADLTRRLRSLRLKALREWRRSTCPR
jgi:tRNA nucleotidyltransferase (CCA-adding enzyme)